MQNLTFFDENLGQYILKNGADKESVINRLGLLEHFAEEKHRSDTLTILTELLSTVMEREKASETARLLIKTVIETLGDYNLNAPKNETIKSVLTPILSDAVLMWSENAPLGNTELILNEIPAYTGILISKFGNSFTDMTDRRDPINLIPDKSIIKIVNLSEISKKDQYLWYIWNESLNKYEEIKDARGFKEYSFVIEQNIKTTKLTIKSGNSEYSGWVRYIMIEN